MATTKIPFRTAYSEHKSHNTPGGSGIWDEYGYNYNKANEKQLVKTGQKNMYEEIQSYHESCKIENILARAAIGDMSDFRPDGIYTDITKLPNNLIDARKEILKVETLWNNMPLDVRRKYGHSLDAFMSDMGNKAWLEATGLIQPEKPEPTPAATAPETTVETPDNK